MSSACKIVKAISLLSIVIGIAAIALAAFMFLSASDAAALVQDGAILAQVSGAVLGIGGVFEVITGFLGVRGANNPARLKPFIVMAAIMFLVNVAEVALTFGGGEGPVWISLLYAVVALVAIVFALRARKAADRL